MERYNHVDRRLDHKFSTAGIGWDAEEGCVAERAWIRVVLWGSNVDVLIFGNPWSSESRSTG